MSPNKRKTIQMEYGEETDFKHRRTSLAVNLSYANLTDSGHGSLRKTQIKNSILSPNQIQSCNELSKEQDEMQYFDKSSSKENTVHKARSLISCKEDKILNNVYVRIVDIRHIKKTDTKFEELKNAILNKTKEIFSQQDECAIKTSLILENQNNNVNKADLNQLVIDEVTSSQATSISSEKKTDSDKLSIFSTPTNKSPKLKKFLNSSKITKRKLFKDVETVTGRNCNLGSDVPLPSTIYTNCNSSPIITSSNRKQRISKLSLKNISTIASKSNIQEDQENVSLSSLMDVTKSIGTPMFCSTFNEEFNRENNPFNGKNNINNQNLEHKNTNTNVVTIELTSCIAQNNAMGINNSSEVKSMEKLKIQETGETKSSSQCKIDNKESLSKSDKNEKNVDHDELSLNVNTSIDNEVEDKNNSEKTTPEDIEQESVTIARSSLQVNTSLNSTYKHRHDNKQQTKKKNTRNSENNDLTSHIECTPYEVPDKVQSKSQLNSNTIKDSTKSNPPKSIEILNISNTQEEDKSINLRNKSCLHEVGKEKNILHKTVILDDSPIVNLDKEKCKGVLINDSLSEPESSKDKTENNILEIGDVIPKVAKKKKLLPLCEDTQLSFSPKESSLSSRKQTAIMKKGSKNKKKRRRNKFPQHFSQTQAQPTTSGLEKHNSDSTENDLVINPKKKKECKRFRNIISKKFIIKKRADNDILKQLENLHTCSDEETEFSENRNSLNEFQTRKKDMRLLLHKSQKINMVVTGFSKGDKHLIKNIVKTLGMAHIEPNVTRRTTHVVSTGVRTLNLLHGIIRGCWLVTLEWVLKSLENNRWLNPEQYEMPHFSKAVQENRKDRELFGMAFVPELFATCGFLHIENETIPPSHALKELVKTAGGRITENPQAAKIIIGTNGIKESWILDSITTGDLQPVAVYKKKKIEYSCFSIINEELLKEIIKILCTFVT